jgi:hypothetical protein
MTWILWRVTSVTHTSTHRAGRRYGLWLALSLVLNRVKGLTIVERLIRIVRREQKAGPPASKIMERFLNITQGQHYQRNTQKP